MNKIRVTHFSDTLCIWAYISQIRIDELVSNYTEQVDINYCLFSVFGATQDKFKTVWGDRGGIQAYNQHVLEISQQFTHVPVHEDVWIKSAPESSLPSHLYLSAVKLLEQQEKFAQGSFSHLADIIRRAFFADLKDISQAKVLTTLLESAELPIDAVHELINSGHAHATLARDMQQAQTLFVRSSPTLLFNEDRQRLAGNVGYRIIEANIRELLEQPEVQQSWC